jgi:SAM-dependent methyltransferase
MTSRWSSSEDVPRGDEYDARWRAMAEAGQNPHGEADFLERLWRRVHPDRPGPLSILDAGCGTGRLAIELARRGHDVEGVDLDPGMLDAARAKGPSIRWHLADLLKVGLDRSFDLVAMAGNVMIFLAPATECAVVANLAAHLAPGGLLVAGFQLRPGGLDVAEYDRCCELAGLTLAERHSSWHDDPFEPAGASYAVSVHRRG